MYSNRPIIILSLSFGLIFLGFNGIQQYVTTYFSSLNNPHLGFISLLLIYLFFMISSPFSLSIRNKIGTKTSLIGAATLYATYILSLLYPSQFLILLSSTLLGIAAGLLWTSQGTYLLDASNKVDYGKNAGIFTTIWAAGAGLGILLFGYITATTSFTTTIIIYATITIAGTLLLTLLPKTHTQTSTQIKEKIKRPTPQIIKIGLINILFMIIFGLVIGSLPIALANHFTIKVIGILGSFSFISAVLFSYYSGKISDKIGRKKLLLISLITSLLGLLLMLTNTPTLLILGIILISLTYAIVKTIMQAIPGDFGNKEQNVSWFNAFQSLGVVIALIIGILFQPTMQYILTIALIIIGTAIAYPEIKRTIN